MWLDSARCRRGINCFNRGMFSWLQDSAMFMWPWTKHLPDIWLNCRLVKLKLQSHNSFNQLISVWVGGPKINNHLKKPTYLLKCNIIFYWCVAMPTYWFAGVLRVEQSEQNKLHFNIEKTWHLWNSTIHLVNSGRHCCYHFFFVLAHILKNAWQQLDNGVWAACGADWLNLIPPVALIG